MVHTTIRPRQASNRINPLAYFLAIAVLALGFGGCQSSTPRQTAAATSAAGNVGQPKIAFLAPDQKPILPPKPLPKPIQTDISIAGRQQSVASLVEKKPPAAPSIVPNVAPITTSKAALNKRVLELSDEVPNWKLTRLSAREWRLSPRQKPSLSDSPPSLMEDAIITSGLHARLQNVPDLRAATWKYSSNSGRVLLSYPSLSCTQALAALRAVVTLDKVVEVQLVTTLR